MDVIMKTLVDDNFSPDIARACAQLFATVSEVGASRWAMDDH